MEDVSESRQRTPVGIILVCLLLAPYGVIWILTRIFAGIVGDELIAVVSMGMAAGVLLLAYFLYLGGRAAWWITPAFIGGSTPWRLSLVAAGEVDNPLNTVIGIVLALYLISQRECYQPARSNRSDTFTPSTSSVTARLSGRDPGECFLQLLFY